MTSSRPVRRATGRAGSCVLAALLVTGGALVGTGASTSATVDDEPVSAFDDGSPAVVRLDPALLGSLRRAVADAADDGVEVRVTSGWRSVEHQERLLREAVDRYGSAREAARWVATPETSAHVSGDAVDVGPSAAATWLSRHGWAYGLCQVYENEPWHFELRTGAVEDGCPPEYADPTADPRMQR